MKEQRDAASLAMAQAAVEELSEGAPDGIKFVATVDHVTGVPTVIVAITQQVAVTDTDLPRIKSAMILMEAARQIAAGDMLPLPEAIRDLDMESSYPAIYKSLAAGKLRGIKIDRRWYVDVGALKERKRRLESKRAASIADK